MKIGRNDPCPCGSGNKYKRCCMAKIQQQQIELQEEIEQVTAFNPNLSLDELNAVVNHKMEDINQRPNADFCGLSPMQMTNWLYAPLSELEGITINTPSCSLSNSPVMSYLTLIIDHAMSNGGKIKTTSKGNLPAKLVKQASDLLPQFAVAQYESVPSISEYCGSNEDKFNALHYTRVLAELAGVIYARRGYLHVKKDMQQVYEKQGIAGLFWPMLEAALRKYNWGYFDSWQDNVDLRTFWLFMLWRLTVHCSLDKLIAEVSCAFPDLLSLVHEDEYRTRKEQLGNLIESRFIVRFLQFWGFVIINPKRYDNGKAISRKVELQPLCSHTFTFSNIHV